MKSITESIKNVKEAILGIIAFIVGLKGFWDLYVGQPEFLSGIFIFIGFPFCFLICIYVIVKTKQASSIKGGKVKAFSRRRRYIAKVSAPLILILGIFAGVSFYRAVRIPSTPKGKIGIWVARIRGDDNKFSAQRGTIQALEFYADGDADLRDLVDIRELPVEISGRNAEEKNEQLQQLKSKYNASIVLWGEIAGFKIDELHPMVTVLGGTVGTHRLSPISEAARKEETSYTSTLLPAKETSLPPERIREPLQLTRYVVGLAYFYAHEWETAARHFEQFIAQGLLTTIRTPEAYSYTGVCYLQVSNKSVDYLIKAKDKFLIASEQYKEKQDWDNYAGAQNNLALVYANLAQRGIDSDQNFRQASNSLMEAIRITRDKDESAHVYVAAQTNLGATFNEMASKNIEPENNFNNSVVALLDAAKVSKARGALLSYAIAQSNLGWTYYQMKNHGIEPTENLRRSVAALEEAAPIMKEQQQWERYAAIQFRVGLEKCLLANEDNDAKLFDSGIESLEESIMVSRKIGDTELERHPSDVLRLILKGQIERGINVEKNRARLKIL